MVVFGIETKPELKSTLYFRDVEERFKEKDLFRNPFKAKIYRLRSGFFVLDMTPVYPPYFYIGYFILLAVLILSGFKITGWLLIPLCLIALGFFWSRAFFFLMSWIGARKYGYKGKFRIVTGQKLLKEVLEWDR